MTSHPDVEALAFFAEDLLEPAEERSVTAHIETCASCATTLDELSGVTRVLAEAPAPALPRNVADLLDNRIAEAARDRTAQSAGPAAAPTGPPPGPPAATVTPIARRRRGFGLPKLLLVAAAAVFVVGGGAAVFNGLLVDHTEESSASPMLQEDTGPESAPDTAQSYSAEAVESGTVYTEGELEAQALAVLAASGEAEEPGQTLGARSQDRLPDGAQGCVTRFEEATGARVTLVDDAFFDSGEGSERVWVLFNQDARGTGVAVIDPRCAQGGTIGNSVLAEGTL